MTHGLLALAVFWAAALLDFAIVRHQQAVEGRRAHAAGRWAIAVYAAGTVGFLAVVESSLWYMIPECLGLYAGNILALRRAAFRLPVKNDVAPCLHGSRSGSPH